MIKTNEERQAPTKLEDVEVTHLQRYKFACNYINDGDSVLDLPCGSGYGLNYISTIKKIRGVGVDIYKYAIEHADELFGNKDIVYVEGNMSTEECFGVFDKIISFEGIEHISLEDGHKFLENVKNMLSLNGKFIISSPRKPHGNLFHIHEYALGELKEVLSKYFDIEEIYGQQFCNIYPLKDEQDAFKYKKFNYIAICKHKVINENT